MNLILASQSPRRKQLLQDARLEFTIVVEETNENFPAEMDYHEVPEFIAKNKAGAVFAKLEKEKSLSENTIILAADTVVILDGKIIGKPKDAEDAFQILSSLSGKTHEVITGVCLQSASETKTFSSLTKVHFNPLSSETIRTYIAEYKPFDKAGSYAIQEWIGLVGIHSIEGDLYNVIGLPVNKVVSELNNFLNL